MRFGGTVLGVFVGAAVASAAWFVLSKGAAPEVKAAAPDSVAGRKRSEPNHAPKPVRQVVEDRAAREPAAVDTEVQPDAPPPPERKPMTAAEERDFHLSRLESSGPAPGDFLVMSRA